MQQANFRAASGATPIAPRPRHQILAPRRRIWPQSSLTH